MVHREQILQQALGLPPEDRAIVVAALEQSLANVEAVLPPDDVDAESDCALRGADFLKELERRSAAFRHEPTSARPAADALAVLRRRQAGEAAGWFFAFLLRPRRKLSSPDNTSMASVPGSAAGFLDDLAETLAAISQLPISFPKLET
jgi:hypothetical protein